jgi:hypothetical protein
MSRNRLRLSSRQRLWLYGSFAVLFITGVAWWVVGTWFSAETEFGPQENGLQPWMLRAHGAAAMIALVVLGSLLPNHVFTGWRMNRNRFTGGGIVALCVALTITGYGLYYAGGEALRSVTSLTHLGLGFAFPVALIWHIRRGRALRKSGRHGPETHRSVPEL